MTSLPLLSIGVWAMRLLAAETCCLSMGCVHSTVTLLLESTSLGSNSSITAYILANSQHQPVLSFPGNDNLKNKATRAI